MDFIQRFLDYLQLEKRYSLHTVKNYQIDLSDFSRFYSVEENSNNIQYATKLHIRTYIIWLSKQSVNERSINRKLSSLRSFYKFLIKIGEISTSPMLQIKSLKTQKKVIVPFTEKEMSRLLDDEQMFSDSFEGIRDRLIINLLYQTGIRRAELIQLKINQFDVSNKTIKVLGKRNKERIIPLSFELVNQIEKYLELRKEIVESDFLTIFSTSKGKPLYDKFVYKIVNHYLSLITEKQKRSPHVLRHTFATQMLDNGAELNAVKEILGHSSLSSTQIYTHGSIQNLKKVFNKAHPREQKKDKL